MSKESQGDIAPDFSAVDAEGRTIHLSDYRGTKHILLVFNRGFG